MFASKIMVLRYWKRILFVGIVVASAVLILTALWLPQRIVLARSQRLVWLPRNPSNTYDNVSAYFWQTDSRMVTSSFHNDNLFVEDVNLDTKAMQPVTSLSRWVWGDDLWYKSLSPDGQWALASVPHTAIIPQKNGKRTIELDNIAITGNSTLVVLSGNQGQQKSTQVVFNALSRAIWLPDSRHWLVFLVTHNGSFVQMHDVRQPKIVRLIPILRADRNVLTSTFFSDTAVSQTHSQTGTSQVFMALISDQMAYVAFLDLRSSPARIHGTTLQVPTGGNLQQTQLSPDGKSLAWLLDFDDRQKNYPPFWDPFWSVCVKGQTPAEPQPYPSEEIWVSRSDGSEMHELGHLSWLDSPYRLTNLRWAPDSRPISYVYHDYVCHDYVYHDYVYSSPAREF